MMTATGSKGADADGHKTAAEGNENDKALCSLNGCSDVDNGSVG